MKITGTVEKKKEIAQKLAEALGVEAVYLRTPSFGYQVGPYLVTKTGDIEVDDTEADIDLLRSLFASDVIDDAWDNSESKVNVTVETYGHTASTLINLLHMVCSREKLLNRSVGNGHAFLIDKKFVKALDDEVPETLDEFFERLQEAGGPSINRGLYIGELEITFSFPYTEDGDIIRAYTQLVELMNSAALNQKRISKEKVATKNEKYTFRVWLMHIGMKGEEYKDTRKILLKNMPGNGAFRTQDQVEVAKEKVKAKRKEAKENPEYTAL